MRGIQLDRILAGTALALVLTLSGQANAQSNNPAAIEAAVPVPEPANVPPPTAADIAKDAPTVTPAAQGTMFETPRAAAPAAAATARRPHRAAGDTAPAAPVASAPAGRRSIRSSARSCAKSSPPAATASSAARASAPASKRSIATAITRRSGSITARRPRARPKPSPICAASMPTASSRPNIRCPISRRPIRPRWRKPSSNSPPPS